MNNAQNKSTVATIPVERVEQAILVNRGEKVILDSDLAGLYGIDTRSLIQALKRNSRRFPADFVFQLTKSEFEALRSQIVISKRRGGSSFSSLCVHRTRRNNGCQCLE